MAAVQSVSLSSLPEFKLNHILAATDFSECSLHALQQAAAIARLHGSDLLVVHAIAPQPIIQNAMEPAGWDLGDVRGQAREEMTKKEIVEMLAGVPHWTMVENGDLQDVLGTLVKEREISLVVVGTHGRSGFKKLLIGSLAEKILRTTECAVLTVGPAEPAALFTHGKFESVLFATDFSHGSMQALLFAAGFAKESHARLTLLHVVEDSSVTALYIHKQLVEEAGKRLEDIARGLGIGSERKIVTGLPIDEILRAADSAKADLIVMGVHKSHGIGARAAAHLPWTIAQSVVCRAKCPVLTVKG